MAKTKSVQIGKTVYTVRELTLQQIKDMMDKAEEDTGEPLSFLLSVSTDMTLKDLMPMAPSELGEVTEAMVEVNASFLEQAARINAKAAAEALEKMIRSVSLIAFLPSSSQVTE